MLDTVSETSINARSGRMPSYQVKQVASFLLGAWALKKFPKVAIFGLVGVGVVLGLTLKQVAKHKISTGPSADNLH